jgi:hypothetical protein
VPAISVVSAASTADKPLIAIGSTIVKWPKFALPMLNNANDHSMSDRHGSEFDVLTNEFFTARLTFSFPSPSPPLFLL